MATHDEIVAEFDARWSDAGWRDKALLLRRLVVYCRHRYGSIESYRDIIEPKLLILEEVVTSLENLYEFLTVADAIGFIRGKIRQRGRVFATGIKGAKGGSVDLIGADRVEKIGAFDGVDDDFLGDDLGAPGA